MHTNEITQVFKVLGDSNRNKIVSLLSEREQTVGELEKSLGQSQSSTSQNLKMLYDAGLVTYRKHGNFRLYSLQHETLKRVMLYFDALWDEGLQKMKANLESNG